MFCYSLGDIKWNISKGFVFLRHTKAVKNLICYSLVIQQTYKGKSRLECLRPKTAAHTLYRGSL